MKVEGGHGARIIGGAPTVLDRRRAVPLIGDAVCNCLIGCAEDFWSCGNSYPYHGARIIGGAPMVLDRRRATPLIGDAVCNCLIGCAESSSTTHYSLLTTL